MTSSYFAWLGLFYWFSDEQLLVTITGFPMIGELNLKEESPFSPPRVKYAITLFHGCTIKFSWDAFLYDFINLFRVEDSHKGGSSGRLLSSLSTGEAKYPWLFGILYQTVYSIKIWAYDPWILCLCFLMLQRWNLGFALVAQVQHQLPLTRRHLTWPKLKMAMVLLNWKVWDNLQMENGWRLCISLCQFKISINICIAERFLECMQLTPLHFVVYWHLLRSMDILFHLL